MSDRLAQMDLKFNPFEPSASGAPVTAEELWLPDGWKRELYKRLDMLEQAQGVKALAIAGEYGSGKSYILKWLETHELPRRRIEPFYFDNPGVQFYGLANALLRKIGRKNFAKLLWELASEYVAPYQQSLFADGFEDYLRGQGQRKPPDIAKDMQDAIIKAGITGDEEIAHRLARIVTEIYKKPYFEYRDFVAGVKDALVSEGEEAPYFVAILSTLRKAAGMNAVAFLIDEFEEVSLQKKLTARAAHDYLATMKRLINMTTQEGFWLITAMTPDGVKKTRELEPALPERFAADGEYLFEVPELTTDDAMGLIGYRLGNAREEDRGLFPFPDELGSILSPATLSSPRRLVKVCFYAISGPDAPPPPFPAEYMEKIEERAYPTPSGEDEA